jgi:hypothetical protein
MHFEKYIFKSVREKRTFLVFICSDEIYVVNWVSACIPSIWIPFTHSLVAGAFDPKLAHSLIQMKLMQIASH